MEKKKWYMSKAIWAGVVGVLLATWNALAAGLAEQCGIEGSFCMQLPATPEWIYGLLAAFGIYGRGSASTRIE